MINFDRFKTALAIAFVGLLLAVLIFTFLTLPGGVGRPRGFSGESLFVVLSVALAMIIGGATVATGVQAIFTQSSPAAVLVWGMRFSKTSAYLPG